MIREPDTAHAGGGRIVGAEETGGGRDKFSPSRRPGGKSVGKPLEVCQGIMDGGGQGQAVGGARGRTRGGRAEDCLEAGEQAAATRDRQDHGPEFTQQLLPFAARRATLGGWDGGEEFMESVEPVGW